MNSSSGEQLPQDPSQRTPDLRGSIAIDLGAESCRVSLLRWIANTPQIQLVHRFPNAPVMAEGGLRWNLAMIEAGVDEGIRRCAMLAPEGIRSLAADGWAVDYVRLGEDGEPIADPFCYRNERTLAAETSLHERISAQRLRALTGIHSLRINTVYQLHADRLARLPSGRNWLNLPEYLLHRLGGSAVAEATNASHTEMVDARSGAWCAEIFTAAGIDPACAPPRVGCGTHLGRLQGRLAALPGLQDVALIAPACHDTASAIAGIPAEGHDWAYISSGTWSLVGASIDRPILTEQAAADGFTNLAGVGETVCFHVNVNGMWMLRQCMEQWLEEGAPEMDIEALVQQAACLGRPAAVFDVDRPELLLAGDMLGRINKQLTAEGHRALDTSAASAPGVACVIFHSLAERYRHVLEQIGEHTGRTLRRLYIVGGGSRNTFLNRLIEEKTGLEVRCGSAESSTIGNFAVQMATLELLSATGESPTAEAVFSWSRRLQGAAL